MALPTAAKGPVLGSVETAIPSDTAANIDVDIADKKAMRSREVALSVLLVGGIWFTT